MLSKLKLGILLLLICIFNGYSVSYAALPEIRPMTEKPSWWLNEGICFVGMWEPLAFRIRNGRVERDFQSYYDYQHSEKTVKSLKAAGVNMVITHFYKGMGPQHEVPELEYVAKQVKYLKKHGMRVGAYIGSTLFSESLYQEQPEAKDWVQLNRSGTPIVYSDQYFRERADFSSPGYRKLIKEMVGKAITEYGMDLIHFDNFYTMFPLDAGYTEQVQELFRGYLREKFTKDELYRRLGLRSVDNIRPPRVANRPMQPVRDPLVQEWIIFRVEVLTSFIRELSEYIRSLSPDVIVEFNPHGIWGENSAYSNGMDHASLLPLSDIFWSEDPDHAHYFVEQNRLVSKIRSYKLARRFGNALFSYNNHPLELAEAMAFNRMCIGDVPWSVIREPEKVRDNLLFMDFFNKNKEIFRGLECVTDVGVMRDFASLTFGGWTPFLSTVQAEQVLIQSRVPFTLLFDQDWQELNEYKVVVLASQHNLSNDVISQLKSYLKQGGGVVVVGAETGAFDEQRRARGSGSENFWNLLGLPAQADQLDKEARLKVGERGRLFYMPEFENHPAVPKMADRVHPDYWYLPLNHQQFEEGLRWCRGAQWSIEVAASPWIACEYYSKGTTRQVHIVNYQPDSPSRLLPIVMDSKQGSFSRVSLHSPGHAPRRLDLGRYDKGWMTVVPEIETYGIVIFE